MNLLGLPGAAPKRWRLPGGLLLNEMYSNRHTLLRDRLRAALP
jgi:hypothetical protein